MDLTAPDTLLEVEDLSVKFDLAEGSLHAVDHLDLTIGQGECLGIVGESGSGKSVTCLSLLGLIDHPGKANAKKIVFRGIDLQHLDDAKWRDIRGQQISIVFQDPMTTLNPLFTVGRQVFDVIKAHNNSDRKQIKKMTLDAMHQAGIPNPEKRYHAYPFELSGGLRQRVNIAMAIANHPNLLIADEPTTALDVSVQAQILDLFHNLKESHQFAIIFISHDLDVIASIADTVMVMYAGQCVEQGSVNKILNNPLHPYTAALLRAAPHLNSDRTKRLITIEGTLPSLINLPQGCRFNPRCDRRIDRCLENDPTLEVVAGKDRLVRCIRPLTDKSSGNDDE